MQNQQEPPQPVSAAPPLAPPAANDPSLTSTELSALQEAGMDLENDGDAMDVSVDDVSEALHELGTSPAPAVAIIELDDEDDNAKDEEEEKADADMGGDDSDGDDSDSDYDLDKDLEDFDEEDDNDEVDEDERFHYFQSLAMEIEDSKAQEKDVYVTNMLAQRDRLTGEEAVWVDKFLKEQEEWKRQNGKSVDDHTRIQALAKFIPGKLERKRPVRATRNVPWLLVGASVSLLLLVVDPVGSCLIAGADTGSCTDPSDFDLLIPFCKSVVPYTACLPRYQSLWYNHSALTKDKFVEQMFTKLVTQRKMYETNKTFLDKNTDEWGGSKEIVPRFVENPDCENAYRNYFCWLNFPRCDAEGRSLLLCRSVCENYMKACQLSKDLWRCGDPKYVNGREAETSVTWINKTLVYYRAPFPGSPFKDNAVDSDTNKPLVVCTPSLENAALSSPYNSLGPLAVWMAMVLSVLLI